MVVAAMRRPDRPDGSTKPVHTIGRPGIMRAHGPRLHPVHPGRHRSRCRRVSRASGASPTTSTGRGARETRNLWSLIDRTAWNRYRNPIPVISGPTEWSRLLDDEKFLAEYQDVLADFDRYMADGSGHWFQRKHGDKLGGPIAYFCAEYGIHESLGIYSGGLGVLAGDHMKSASDMALPFVGVGLLYRKGYFRQSIDADGHQEHNYPDYDLSRLPLARVQDANGLPLTVNVELPGRDLSVAVWLAQVGRVPVLLLDTDVARQRRRGPADHPHPVRPRPRDAAAPGARAGHRRRARHPGARARAGGLAPQRGPLGIPARRARPRVRRGGPALGRRLGTGQARQRVHDPHAGLGGQRALRRPTSSAASPARCSTRAACPVERVLELGLGTDGDRGQFDMTAFSLRLTNGANAVSKLHAHTANSTWQGIVEHEILAITNGVHGPTWVGSPVVELLSRHLDADLDTLDAGARQDRFWERLGRIPTRRAVGGAPPPEARAGDLRPRPAAQPVRPPRRVAVGPRRGRDDPRSGDPDDRLRPPVRDLQAGGPAVHATWIASRACCGTPTGRSRSSSPGKAHPADRPGQKVIQEIFQRSRSPKLRGRVFILEDYDMRVAPVPRPGRRRVAQQPAPAARGVRDVGHEGGPERRPQHQRARWLVGRGLPGRQRLGDRRSRDSAPTRPPRTGPTPRTSTGCSRRSSSRATTSATRPASRSAGSRRCAARWPPRSGGSPRPACSRSTPSACTCRRPASRSRSRSQEPVVTEAG